MHGRSARSRSGISLVEILIIIAVIAILAGILFPLFSRAKGQGRRAQCAANLKQLGNAFALYVNDWSGVYPAPGGLWGDQNYWSQSGRGGLVSYVGRNGGIGTVWCCPEQTEWHGIYPPRTYSMNSYLRNPPDAEYPTCIGILRGCPESFIEDKARTILLYEGMPITAQWPWTAELEYIFRCGNWICVRGYYPQDWPRLHTQYSWLAWHGEKNNYLYCDGHVRCRPPGKRTTGSMSTREEMLQWRVQKSAWAQKYKGY